MIKLLKIIFFCCAQSEEPQGEIESIEKKDASKNTTDKNSTNQELKIMDPAHSEERNSLKNESDSSESLSISSGSNR
jgi:hypothetical protein